MKTSLSPVFRKQMEQMRSIQGTIFNNDAMGELSPLTRLLFAGLWCLADNKGRTEDKPRKLKKVIMGYDDISAGDIDEMLQSLHDKCFIVRYSTNGSNYIQVSDFSKYKNPILLRKQSLIPPPEFQ
ncbi:hypothetical protein [Syntrophomonas wolfei]|jgi:hypothetical protein|uniref:hypothetical protein n=1 Tax=Syntrophomonas wolfei TaxID=863 RepID=UPI0023F146B9|nr:hypothetical protein [Syntrophomonas wolfei]